MWPKLFERPIIGGLVRQIERLSILVLVGSMLFQLSTGLLNIAQWYAFKFFFTTSHYAMAYVAAGAVLVHIGGQAADHPSRTGGARRRHTGIGRADAAHGAARDVACGGAGHRRHGGPDDSAAAQGVGAGAAFRARAARGSDQPVGDRGGCAAQRAVTGLPVDGDERVDDAGIQLADLQAMPQATHRLPIACVEGWSVDAEWTGVVLADLVAAVGGSRDSDVRMISLEPPGPYSRTVVPARHARDAQDIDRAEAQRPDAGPRPRISMPADRADQTRCAADEMAVAHRGGGAMRRHHRSAITRIALIVLGLILGAYGAVLVWENPPVIIMRILVWALVGVVLHDAVFAPVCVALRLRRPPADPG